MRQRVPKGTLINLYGSSEVAGDVTFYQIDEVTALERIPIGRPIANSQIYIGKTQRSATGGAGSSLRELLVGGVGLARGYDNLPELTAERFIINPFDDTGVSRLYRSGDLARYGADGQIEYLGRLDRQIKIRGVRIEPAEVEAHILAHADIAQAVVLPGEDISGAPGLTAYILARPEYRQTDLQNGANVWCVERLRQWREVLG